MVEVAVAGVSWMWVTLFNKRCKEHIKSDLPCLSSLSFAGFWLKLKISPSTQQLPSRPTVTLKQMLMRQRRRRRRPGRGQARRWLWWAHKHMLTHTNPPSEFRITVSWSGCFLQGSTKHPVSFLLLFYATLSAHYKRKKAAHCHRVFIKTCMHVSHSGTTFILYISSTRIQAIQTKNVYSQHKRCVCVFVCVLHAVTVM